MGTTEGGTRPQTLCGRLHPPCDDAIAAREVNLRGGVFAACGEPVEPSESRRLGGLRCPASQRLRCMSITSENDAYAPSRSFLVRLRRLVVALAPHSLVESRLGLSA